MYVSQEKRNYHEAIHDGGVGIKETIKKYCYRLEKSVCRPFFF